MIEALPSTLAALTLEISGFNEPDPDPFSFVALPIGSFVMGGSDDDRFVTSVELPRQTSRVSSPIAMGRSPVTVGDWHKFRPAQFARSDIAVLPMVDITWDDAIAYTEWLSDVSGRTCRLPTEAEWEYASRAGKEGLFPSGRNQISPREANFLYNERGEPIGCGYRTPIGCYPPNAFGLYDMSGNVSEWTSSPWRKGHHQAFNEHDGRRVIRGGSWDQLPRTLRCSWRDWAWESATCDNLGFRVVVELD
ncbi:MAG: SUMF1/EgtB/PvdO family nonheme iron enzyme [Verrucomicrobiota bacterium]